MRIYTKDAWVTNADYIYVVIEDENTKIENPVDKDEWSKMICDFANCFDSDEAKIIIKELMRRNHIDVEDLVKDQKGETEE